MRGMQQKIETQQRQERVLGQRSGFTVFALLMDGFILFKLRHGGGAGLDLSVREKYVDAFFKALTPPGRVGGAGGGACPIM